MPDLEVGVSSTERARTESHPDRSGPEQRAAERTVTGQLHRD